jgi:hypothetical protein
VGDVGQNLWEEANIVDIGRNYGWNIREGTHCFDPNDPEVSLESCADTGPLGNDLVDPILEYPSGGAGDIGTAIIGGMIYRGAELPAFQGRYIFGDWSTGFGTPDGTLFVAEPPSDDVEVWRFEELAIPARENGRLGEFVLSFGQDADLELYILTSQMIGPIGETGTVYKIVPPE